MFSIFLVLKGLDNHSTKKKQPKLEIQSLPNPSVLCTQ